VILFEVQSHEEDVFGLHPIMVSKKERPEVNEGAAGRCVDPLEEKIPTPGMPNVYFIVDKTVKLYSR
jgi:hypothetical protein